MSRKNIVGSISIVMVIMVLSRLLSLVSSSVYMSFYGADNLELNIYSYAINIPNIIFTCFGTALSAVVIPIYASHIASGNRSEATRFANNIITANICLSAVLILIGLAISPILPKFTDFNEGYAYSFATKALMIMMPVMLFYGLNFIFQGMLQSEGEYVYPALVSVPSSLVVICYVFTLGERFGVWGLLVATFIGLSLQAFILIPPLRRAKYRYKMSFEFKSKDIVTALKMTPPVLVGVSAYQINMFYNTSMIAMYDGFVALLTYVQNLALNLVLAFVNSVISVLYPKLTQSYALRKTDEYKETLSGVMVNVWLFLVPISFGFAVMSKELLDLVIGWGKTDTQSVNAASRLMIMYSFGIIGVGSKEILDRAFYAIKDTKTPAINGFIIMVVNIVTSQILMRKMGPYGLPLAYSISSLCGLLILMCLLYRKVGSYTKGIFTLLIKYVAASFVMLVVVIWVKNILPWNVFGSVVVEKILKLFVPTFCGMFVYAVMLVVLRVPIARKVVRALIEKAGLVR